MSAICDRCGKDYEVGDDFYNPAFQGDFGEMINMKEQICPDCEADLDRNEEDIF